MDEQATTPKSFNANGQFKVSVPVGRGIETVIVRFPEDADWIERQRQREIVTRIYPDGAEETSTNPTLEFDQDLIAKLRVEGPETDGYESGYILSLLEKADVIDVQPEGAGYRVKLRVAGGTVTEHLVRNPTQRELAEYRQGVYQYLNYQSKRKTIIRLGVCRSFYDGLAIESKGYAGHMPIIHKASVAGAILGTVNAKTGDAQPVNP